ncbi:MAG TPA: BrnT family toxin, partial [Longimicrobiaceae bacterium]|nr:BrnT family toxin [Longimicrobiaceae bacterium]
IPPVLRTSLASSVTPPAEPPLRALSTANPAVDSVPPPKAPFFNSLLEEERLLLLGQSTAGRYLVVALTERGDTVRIISARLMTSRERRTYERQTRS